MDLFIRLMLDSIAKIMCDLQCLCQEILSPQLGRVFSDIFFDDIFEFSSKFYPKPLNLVGIHNDFAKSKIDYSGSTTRKDLL